METAVEKDHQDRMERAVVERKNGPKGLVWIWIDWVLTGIGITGGLCMGSVAFVVMFSR